MGTRSKTPSEWRDGFLFVGNHLALDLLNTRPFLADGPKELLPDVDALVRWLVASGALPQQKSKSLTGKWSETPQAAAILRELLEFRERLRAAVLRKEAGSSVSTTFITEVNALLRQHPSRITLRRKGEKLDLDTAFELQRPNDVWAPIAISVAELLSNAPQARLRKCEACVVHFFDTSKKGSRRWCSMNICGNKIKVAAYQQRQRSGRKSKLKRRNRTQTLRKSRK